MNRNVSKTKARWISLLAQRENKLASGEKGEFQGQGDGLEVENPNLFVFNGNSQDLKSPGDKSKSNVRVLNNLELWEA